MSLNTSVTTFSDADIPLARKAAEAWSSVSVTERKHNELLAEQEKLEHARNHPLYIYCPGNRAGSRGSKCTRSGSVRKISTQVFKRRKAPKGSNGTKVEEGPCSFRDPDISFSTSLAFGRSSSTPARYEKHTLKGSHSPMWGRDTSIESPGLEQSSPSTYPLTESPDASMSTLKFRLKPYDINLVLIQFLPQCIPSPPVLEGKGTTASTLNGFSTNWDFPPPSTPAIPSQSSQPSLAAMPELQLLGDLYPLQHYAAKPWRGSHYLEQIVCGYTLHDLSYGIAQDALMIEDLTFKLSNAEEQHMPERLDNFNF
ncbi:hypothetical protein E1B28_002380 [Marasmius oreades]|uniref:HMG box domain-containing protein n=1 Tax=Marasmius oreades TaxID=181124 RepID=A0A9P7RMI5_9AGAR|nr:uncharacterized protein E1B28_002380 [Marasmius oreades]KAG7086426.1 hypothetical protein E1B28_002380 [Marasmius oreades]